MYTETHWFHTSLIYGFVCDWLPNMSYTYLYRDLSFNNKLSSIPDGAFSGLKQLEVLWEKIYFKTYNLFVNRIREMVSFKLGKEVQKDLLRLQLSWDWNKEKILGSHGIRFLMGTQNFYLSQARENTKNVLLHSTCFYQKLLGNPKTC